MTESGVFVHELSLEVGDDNAEDVDAWISGYIDDTAGLSGFVQADVFRPDENRRRLQVRIDGESNWNHYLSELHAVEELAALFGESISVDARPLGHSATIASDRAPEEHCLNCGAVLKGQYCGDCGQRASGQRIRLPELIRDAFGDLFELDSRLWRTLIPLAVRPGRLTRDYLMGRRARYMPPFRMYLVLSLLFFLVAFFNPRERLGILFEAESSPAETFLADDGASETGAPGPGIDLGGEVEPDIDSPGLRVVIDNDGEENSCDFADYDPGELPDWLSKRLTRERLTAACNNILTEDRQVLASVLDRMAENIPAGLFVLLPVMAFLLMLIHPLSGRFYVEHLLFVLHYHTFIFLILTADVILARLSSALGFLEVPGEIAVVATMIYVPVYLYKALRRVYESGHLLTTLRFLLLSTGYFLGLGLIVLIATLFAAFSV